MATTTLKNLKKDFLEDGTLRAFRIGENDQEFIYYEDKFNRLIFREALLEDVDKILSIFSTLNSKEVEKALKYNSDKEEMVIIVETKTKFLAIIETKELDDSLYFKISFKNAITRQMNEEKVLKGFISFVKKELLYEDVYHILGNKNFKM